MSDCRPAKISISPGVANSLIFYENQAEKGTVAWYQSAVKMQAVGNVIISQHGR